MALIECAECGREVSDKAAACPQCGAPVAPPVVAAPKRKKAKKSSGCGSVIAALMVGTVALVVLSNVMRALNPPDETSGPSASGSGTDSPGQLLLAEAETDPELRSRIDERYAAMVSEWESQQKAALGHFVVRENDDIEGVTYYAPSSAPKYASSRSTVHGVFSVNHERGNRRYSVVFNYAGTDWVFWDRATLKAGTFKADFVPDAPTRDNGGGRVWERATVPVLRGQDAGQLGAMARPVLVVMGASDDSVVRFSGKYREDHKLRSWERQSLTDLVVLSTKKPILSDAANEVADQSDSQDEPKGAALPE
jgi:hypothetical protein